MAGDRYTKLRSRRTDPVIKASGINEVYERLAEDTAVKYAVGAMQPIDPLYTQNTIAEGDRVRNQLRDGLSAVGMAAEFCYQGSVTSDTHIRAHSDVDLLTLHTAFYALEPPLPVTFPYFGDPLSDLKKLRRTAVDVLKKAFPAVTVDDSKGKAIALSGGSLRREIDVVIANWWNTVQYQATGAEHERGIEVYDAKAEQRIENKPFLHNRRIAERDMASSGSLRKMIRLLKSLKYDADPAVDLSSYDIASIAYRMPDDLLRVPAGGELILVRNAEVFLRRLLENPLDRFLLMVPNEMRRVFADGHATEAGLRQLHREVTDLVRDIELGLQRSFRKLAEARLFY